MAGTLLTYKAAALCKVPRPIPKVVTPLTADQGRLLLEAAAGHRLGIYGHLLPQMTAAAAARMDTLLEKRKKA